MQTVANIEKMDNMEILSRITNIYKALDAMEYFTKGCGGHASIPLFEERDNLINVLLAR